MVRERLCAPCRGGSGYYVGSYKIGRNLVGSIAHPNHGGNLLCSLESQKFWWRFSSKDARSCLQATSGIGMVQRGHACPKNSTSSSPRGYVSWHSNPGVRMSMCSSVEHSLEVVAMEVEVGSPMVIDVDMDIEP